MDLKIVSINIEKDRHLERIIPFLQEQKPDIILMQEVLAKDVRFLERTLEMMNSSFTVLSSFRGVENSKFGLLNLSNIRDIKTYSFYYRGEESNPPEIGNGEAADMARAILVTELVKEEQQYCIINTHFTWTPDGNPSKRQFHDIEVLLKKLSEIPEFILCGDFNAPRGGPIFDKISEKYKDNIPMSITTTIDQKLHKRKGLYLVVDGIFTTPKYRVDFLDIKSGLSDHCAILAKVSICTQG